MYDERPGYEPFPLLTVDHVDDATEILLGLGHFTRLRMIEVLIRHNRAMSVNHISQFFDYEQPTISHHLRVLRDADLVKRRRAGYFMLYSAVPQRLVELRRIINRLVPEPTRAP